MGYIFVILMGITLGLMGGGGAILTVPIFVYLFKIDPLVATAYSLFVVGATALAGGVFYLKRGQVDLKTGLIFAVPSFISVYLTRSWLLPALPDPVFSLFGLPIAKAVLVMGAFALVMILAATSMIKGNKAKPKSAEGSSWRWILVPLQGIIVGLVSGFVGAGGGFLIVPALVIMIGMNMKTAVGTSLMIIAANSLLGFIGDLQNNLAVDWLLLFKVLAIALIGLIIGTRLSSLVPDSKLKKGFGIFVLVMGTLIMLDQIVSLSKKSSMEQTPMLRDENSLD